MPSNVNINLISPPFRDVLLGLNLQPSTSISVNSATNYVTFLGGVGNSTAVGLPFVLNAVNSNTTNIQNPSFLNLNQNGIVWRPYNYTLNQFEGIASDYVDTAILLGSTPLLPNAGGAIPYGISYVNSVVGPAPIIYNPNTIPDNPYDAKLTNINPYVYSVGKNIFDNINGVNNNYQLSYVNSKSYLGLTFGAVPNVYSPTTIPNEPYNAQLTNTNPYFYSVGKNIFNSTTLNYSLTNNPSSPIQAVTNVALDDNNNPYGPNLNLNLYKGNKDELVFAPNTFTNTIGITNQKEGYLDANGKLNVGGTSTEPYNIISSLLHGGVGFNKNGSNMSVVSNNDIRNTIVGRALTATGLINDTQLGMIGAERLAISLANNSATKLQKETIGRVNLDIFSWIDGKKDDFIVPNYEITVPAGKLGKTLDFLGDLAGFTMPRSQMKTDFFSFDDKFKPTLIGNIARANGMLETTGKGQVIALFRNLQASLFNSNIIKQGYVPGMVNKRVDGDDAIIPNIYAYGNSDGEILENHELKRADSAQYNNSKGDGNGNGRWTDTDGSGFEGEYFNFKTNGNGGNFGTGTESDFIWSDKTVNIDKNDGNSLIAIADEIFGPSPADDEANSLNQPNRKSILYKTKELFKNGNMSTMVNGHAILTDKSQIQSAVLENGFMSKGNAALTKLALDGNFDDKSKIYCRTWTPMDKYDQITDLIRHRKLDGDGGDYKRRSPLSEFSVLENTGFVKIARYVTDSGSVKRHMFSIENLAWMGQDGKPGGNPSLDLAPCEKGPFGGRIMWFPPYDIKFSESTSVNWDKHNFIGRGEPMYTYNNTERTGQLSFKIIIDHPNQLNAKGSKATVNDDHYASFFAGCNPADVLSPNDLAKADKKINTPTEIKVDDVKPGVLPTNFSVFFPNDNSNFPVENPEYESGLADASGVNNINPIVWTKADENQYISPINYNNFMGNPISGVKTLGPISPIGLVPSAYNLAKIDYKIYKKGEYLGLGMTHNSKMTVSDYTSDYTDRFNYGLNGNRYDNKNLLVIPGVGTWGGWLATNDITGSINKSYLESLKEYIHWESGTCKKCVIKILGYASVQGSTDKKKERNKKLSDDRAETIKKYLLENIIDSKDPFKDKRIIVTTGQGETTNEVTEEDTCDGNKDHQDSISCKLSRRTAVIFSLMPESTPITSEEPKNIISENTDTIQTAVISKIKDFYAECDYFNKLSESDPFTYSKITDKIKYFSPAFHSTTPEGFNARLTFLQQCTRQGPSLYTNSSKPDNLVFGRPPVCVLRIGDFYYTKIIIENISFDFEPLVWDLNPEGVGVQPMIANVSMNFAFIGGSSLDGPISKLQNALSSNYFANTGLFDSNADDNQPKKTNQQDIDKLIADRDNNKSVYEADQIDSKAPETDKALTSQELDIKILEEGILSLNYDDSGIFQGKVKGTFTVKSKLSKEYTVKLMTKAESTDPTKNLGDEPIDVQKLKINELKLGLTSKTKTTNSLQKWDYYFTDTNKRKIDYNMEIQKDLDEYVKINTDAKGWDYSKNNVLTNLFNKNNYDFVIEVEELKFKKIYKANWSPIFKYNSTKSSQNIKSYETYLSGGKLAILNNKYETPDEEAKAIKIEAKENKAETKSLKKDKKIQSKEDKKAKKDAIDKQKALVAEGGGSLI